MELEKLLEKDSDKALWNNFILSIDKFFDIMSDKEVELRNTDLINLNINEINKDFSITSKSFIEVIVNSHRNETAEIRKTLEYFKICFIQFDNDVFSICFSLSSKEDHFFGENDSFFIIDNKELKLIYKEEFEKYNIIYKNKLLKEINSKTQIEGKEIKNTEVISYKLKDLYLFLIYHFILESDFKYTKLYFKMIKFEEKAEVPNKQNKLSLVVRAENNSKTSSGSYYDFGTVYP